MSKSTFLRTSAIVLSCLALGACVGGKSGIGSALNGAGDPSRTIDPASLKIDRSICPPLIIKNGTGQLTAYAKGGDDGPRDVVHQATLTKSAKECTTTNGVLSIRIGASGRALVGPKSTSNTFDLPIRVVVVKTQEVGGKPEVLYTKLHKLPVSTNGGATPFSFVDEAVSVPAPTEKNYQVFVGFDTGA